MSLLPLLVLLVVLDRKADWRGWTRTTNCYTIFDDPFGILGYHPLDRTSPKVDETDFSENYNWHLCHLPHPYHVQFGFVLVHGFPHTLESSLAHLLEHLNGFDLHRTDV